MPVHMNGGHRRVALAMLSLLACGVSTAALAGGFALREQSAVGQGASFAGVAAGGGDSISGMFWNPAVVNDVETYQGETHVSGIFGDSKITTKNAPYSVFGTKSGNIAEPAALPAGYNAYRINDKLAIGLVTGAPFGLATDPKTNYGGQLFARRSQVVSYNATPTVGYKVTDWLSVGAGVQLQYFHIKLRRAVGIAPGAPNARLEGDDIGVGWTAGVNFRPTEGTDIGVGFRSKIKHNLDGKLSGPFPIGTFGIKANVTLPEMVTVGVRQKVTDDLTLLAGFEWTNWSRLSTVAIPPSGQVLTFNYRDGFFYSVGGEYKVTPDITVRTGFAYEKSPITDRVRTSRLPDDNRYWLSAGGSYEYSKNLSFDLGYSYVFVSGTSKITEPPPALGLPPYRASAKTDIHIVSAALRYTFSPDPEPALVTKY